MRMLLILSAFFSLLSPVASTPWWDLQLMSDDVLNSVLMFYLGHTAQGMADIGEVLDTGTRILNYSVDEYSWSNEWLKTADRVRNLAVEFEGEGNPISAGQSFLRASSYYRAVVHRYPSGFDPIQQLVVDRQRECFLKGVQLLEFPVEVVDIPYENTSLPGYLWRSSLPGRRPTLIIHNGRDAWKEDGKFLGEGCVARGYHCLLFDGPGQGEVLRAQGLPFRPDWERVISPVVDFVLALDGVDSDRLGLLGMSMGGFLAPRGAALEPRIKFVIANPGVLDWNEVMVGQLRYMLPDVMPLYPDHRDEFDEAMKAAMQANNFIKWGVDDMLWKHGVDTPSDLMDNLQLYTSRGIFDKFQGRLLSIDGEDEIYGQAKELVNADCDGCVKDYFLFLRENTASLHCQEGAIAVGSARIFSWLAAAFA